jgi:hypothetical protein
LSSWEDHDATPDLTEVQQAAVTDAFRRILVERAVVEQVKGVLMVVYGITADQAFVKLRECSQNSDIKLHPANPAVDRVVQFAVPMRSVLPARYRTGKT